MLKALWSVELFWSLTFCVYISSLDSTKTFLLGFLLLLIPDMCWAEEEEQEGAPLRSTYVTGL